MADSDLYNALIGAPVDSTEKQRVLADLLRRKAGFASVAQLTGDPALAPMGEQQAQQAAQQAQQLQRGQQQAQAMAFDQEKEARQAAAQQQQMDLERSAQALTRRGQDLNFSADLARLEAEKAKAGAKAPTEAQASAQAFLGRMQGAEKLLGNYVPSTTDFAAASRIYGGGGALTSAIANKYMSSEGRKYYQAAVDWVRAKLRKESGAAIGDQEMAHEIRTYFPLPGDDSGAIAQKAAARKAAEAEMMTLGNVKQKQVVRTGRSNGKKVAQYDDGSVEYVD